MGLEYIQAYFNNREKKILKALRVEKRIQTQEEFYNLYNADLYIIKKKRYRIQDSLRIKSINIEKEGLREKNKPSMVRSTAT